LSLGTVIQLSLSTVQLLMGRRTRTPTPIAGTQLSTPTAPTAKSALTDAKRRQAIYYNRSTKHRATIPVGQTVRFPHDEHDWRKAEVARILPHRSYEVNLADGSRRRRTSRHVRFPNEPPLVLNQDTAVDSPPPVELNTSLMPPSPRPSAETTSTATAIVSNESAPTSQLTDTVIRSHGDLTTRQRQPPTSDAAAAAVKTRPGRVIWKPARFAD